ncbi:MAG: VOC family protein [Gammaproteobacteria bacterium]|nr:VOC family protein [Gammaproteobacteria bacterium]
MTDLDHIVIAAPDLDAAKQEFLDATGVLPSDGGPHIGAGTRNALIAFAGRHYIELIAPDPSQDLSGNRGSQFATLDKPTVIHWACRTTGLVQFGEALERRGIAHTPTRRMSRALPNDEGILEWELMNVGDHDEGGLVPFFIDWLECTHPSETSTTVGALTTFRVSAPAGSVAAKVLDPAPGNVEVVVGAPAITIEFESPNGTINYEVAAPAGFPRV